MIILWLNKEMNLVIIKNDDESIGNNNNNNNSINNCFNFSYLSFSS